MTTTPPPSNPGQPIRRTRRSGEWTWKRHIATPATDGVTPQRSWRNTTSVFDDPDRLVRLFTVLFFALLALVMIRITTGDADSLDARLARREEVASGDSVKQFIYFVAFFLFLGLWIRVKGIQLPKCLSIFQIVLIGWILCSVTWAIDFEISLRRAVLLLMVATLVSIAVDIVGPKRSISILTWLLALCITMSLFTVPFFSFAIHQSTEADPSLIGAWRGIFVHKNTAGAVSAVTIIIFLHHAIEYKRWYYWLVLLISIVFLIGTKSKTPMGLVSIALAVGILYRYVMPYKSRRWVFAYMIITGLVIIGIAYAAYSGEISHMLDDPKSFTGRAGLWQAVLGYASDHLWFGAGYSSLWGVSGTPPILPYTTAPAQEFMIHSHSGYFELLGTIGLPGLVLALIAAIIYPAYQLANINGMENRFFSGMTMSVFVFAFLENFFETHLYTRDREIWIILFIFIVSLHLMYLDRPVQQKRRKMQNPNVA